MIWLKNLRGLKVICDTKCIGRVLQGCVSDSFTALDGIWVDSAFRGVRFICAEHICVLGKDSVITDSKGERLRMKPRSILIRAVSTDGMRIGAVTDTAIDEHSFAVKKLALTKSWLESLAGKIIYTASFKYDPASSRIILLSENQKKEVDKS